MSGALIVTADFAAVDFAFFDGDRRAHFPPERNILAAHLTMFHALPPSVEPELRRRLAAVADRPAPRAMLAGLRSLGSGVARDLLIAKKRHFVPRPVGIAGLALHRYMDGPWNTLQRWPFRGT